MNTSLTIKRITGLINQGKTGEALSMAKLLQDVDTTESHNFATTVYTTIRTKEQGILAGQLQKLVANGVLTAETALAIFEAQILR